MHALARCQSAVFNTAFDTTSGVQPEERLSWSPPLSCDASPASVSAVEKRNVPNARAKPASDTGQPNATTNAAVARKLKKKTTNRIRISEIALFHRQAGPRQFESWVL